MADKGKSIITHPLQQTPSSKNITSSRNRACSRKRLSSRQRAPTRNIEFHTLHDVDGEYTINHPIGTGPPRRSLVYSASFFPDGPRHHFPTNSIVAVKMIRVQGNIDNFGEALSLISRNERQNSENVLKLASHFLSNGFLCVPFPHDTVSSLRSLLPPQQITSGLPENAIKIALRETLYGLVSIHGVSADEMHRELSAGNVFYHQKERLIKVAFAATVYDPYFATNRVEIEEDEEVGTSSGFLAMRNVTKWGRAPEVRDVKRDGKRYEGFTQMSDVWMFGVMALELAYGEIPVRRRDELLDLAKRICRKKRLPERLWKEVKEEEEEEGEKKKWKRFGEMVKKLKGLLKNKEKRFSKSFGKMVAKCLVEKPEKRPRPWDLLDHKFFKEWESITVFHETVVQRRQVEEAARREGLNEASASGTS